MFSFSLSEHRVLCRWHEAPQNHQNVQSDRHEIHIADVDTRKNVYFQFDSYLQPTCFGPRCTRIAGPNYTISREKDGSLHVITKLPFTYTNKNGERVRKTLSTSDEKKDDVMSRAEKELQRLESEIKNAEGEKDSLLQEAHEAIQRLEQEIAADEGGELLRSIASPRTGWNAYQAKVPTGKSFSVRIGSYVHPIRIGANTVSYGRPQNSIGFYIRRTKGTNGFDTVTVESTQSVSDAKIEG